MTKQTPRQTPPSATCPRCGPSDIRRSACAVALQRVHAAAAANATRTPSGGHNAAGPSARTISRLWWGAAARAVQNLRAKRHAYSARTAMLTVLAHTSATSPAPKTRAPESAVAMRAMDAAAIMRLCARRSAGVHTDARNASSTPL